MTPLYFWREHPCVGAQEIAGPFPTPEAAGRWRRAHPPLLQPHGPALKKQENGVDVELEDGERIACFAMFGDTIEPRYQQMDFGEDIVKFP